MPWRQLFALEGDVYQVSFISFNCILNIRCEQVLKLQG
jgi:hypothetical protein